MNKIAKYIFVFLFLSLVLLFSPVTTSAHQPRLIYTKTGDIQITNPELSQAFYDELKGNPRIYYLDFPAQGGPASGWKLYINLLVPNPENQAGRYSAKVFSVLGDAETQIALVDGSSVEWKDFYEPFGRDWYYKGPEFTKDVPGGKYKIEVFSNDNKGKYVMAVGQTEAFGTDSILNVYWQIPLLKVQFFKTSVLQFFLTPFGIGAIVVVGVLLILIALIYYVIGLIKDAIKHNEAKTLLLTSSGMPQMQDEIIKLLQKPAYDVTVAFITTASKPQENKDYLERDLQIMKQIGFNVEEVDIDQKSQMQVMRLLEKNDIIFVSGGNTFYLMKAMRACNFEKVIRKLLKLGKVYIGASAGSIVAGKTIETASWLGDENNVNLRDLKGLGLVRFNIFPHYQSDYDEIIRKKIKNPKKRLKKLMIITDDQGILVQAKEVDLIGDGEAIVV